MFITKIHCLKRMTAKLISLVLAFCMLMVPCVSAIDAPIISENFENLAIGVKPSTGDSTWSTVKVNDPNMALVQVEKDPESSNKVLQMSILSGNSSSAETSKNLISFEDTTIFETKLKPSGTNGFSCCVSLSLSIKPPEYPELVRFKNGEVTFLSGDDKRVVQTYEAGKWYSVAVTIDANAKTASLSINGEKKADKVPITSFSYFKRANIRITVKNDKNNVINALLDDIKLYKNATAISEDEFTKAIKISRVTLEEKMKGALALRVGSPNVYYSSQLLKIDPQNQQITPIVKDNRTLVPVRFISESFGATVSWDEDTSTIGIIKDDDNIQMVIGINEMFINAKTVSLEVPPVVVEGRTLIPLRAILEALDKKLFWDDRALIVISDNSDFFDSINEKKLIDELDSRILYGFVEPKASEILAKLKEINPDFHHPRIMVTKDTFSRIKKQIETDDVMKKWYDNVKIEADRILTLPLQTDMGVAKQSGISGIFCDQIPKLAMMYNLTGEEKYAQRAWQQLEIGAKFDDWQITNTVETGYMTTAYGIGYDWLYHYLNKEQRNTVRNAIVEKALNPVSAVYRGESGKMNSNWVKLSHNWNLVCNGGFGIGALAIADEEEKLSGAVLEAALKSLEKSVVEFAPDGGWSEGVGYWKYGLKIFLNFMSALDTSVGTNYGFMDVPGLDKTGYYPYYMLGSGGIFSFGDSGSGRPVASELFYLAKVFHNPDLVGLRFKMMNEWGQRGSVEDLIWYEPQKYNTEFELPLDINYRNVETAAFRSAWSDQDAIFAGFHAGYNLVNHGDLDIGTFVLDALGKRWAEDLGKDNYVLSGYFDVNQSGARHTYYRKNAEGQNTLVINPDSTPGQDTTAFSKIDKYVSKPQGGYAITDMSKAYSKSVTKAKRGLMLFDNRSKVLVQDEIETKSPSEVYWFMHTKADIQINDNGRSATLKLGDKSMIATILGNKKAVFSVMDAKPLATSPNPKGQNANAGIKKLTIHLSGISKLQLGVLFTPMQADSIASAELPKSIPLEQWTIPNGDIYKPTIEDILIDGTKLSGFVPEKYNYSVDLTSEIKSTPKLEAISNLESNMEVSVLQGEDIPGTAYIWIVNKDSGKILSKYSIRFNLQGVNITGISASGNDGNLPENTLDNDAESRWSVEGENQWIQYDLGESKTVSQVAISWYKGDERASNFSIEASNDGASWEKVYSGQGSGISNDSEIYKFNSVVARYVRIVCNGNNVNKWNSISEVGIY